MNNPHNPLAKIMLGGYNTNKVKDAMKENDLLIQITKLEQEIKTLPKGYISRKTITGKIKCYLQWREDGKKHSKYINDENISLLENKINYRRELQSKLKELKKLLPKEGKVFGSNNLSFNTTVLLGEQLKSFISISANLKKRNCYEKLKEYLSNDVFGKVFILYGLRRTGKTTLIRQVIYDMPESHFLKAAFIQVHTGNNLAQINDDLKKLMQNGFKYVFIDEVTLMEDFIEGAALFSDVYASCGMKIVLSGTDSLGFVFSEDNQLYDRAILLHTTFIPYREFESVLGIKGIDEYIRYGGTMSISGVHYNETSTFHSKTSTDEYINSAIARNIQRSLRCYEYEGHFRHLRDLYQKNELTSAINRLVEDINHRFTLEVLTKDFKSNDLGISQKNLRRDKLKPTDILDKIDEEKLVKRLREYLEIKNKDEQTVKIQEIHKKEIKEYLDLLDLTFDIDIQTIPVSNEKQTKTVFSQPGMRYCQAEALVNQLLLDNVFQTLSIDERNYVCTRILDEVKGRMMEDIVLLETRLANKNADVFKLQFAVGEFDMVVFDKENNSCKVYEIKHSKQRDAQQYKNLIDEKKCSDTQFRYGKITDKIVIYRGETVLENGIQYVNVEEYLNRLG